MATQETRIRSRQYTPFALSIAQSDRQAAVVVAGELDLESSGALEAGVSELRRREITEIVLDLRGVEFIDSFGLRVLLAVRNDAERDGHALTLIPPAPTVQRIFDLTATRGLFDWRGDRAEP